MISIQFSERARSVQHPAIPTSGSWWRILLGPDQVTREILQK